MQMAVIIDLFLAVVLVLCTVLGFRRGAFKSVIGIVIVVAALIGAGGFGALVFQGLLSSALDLVLLGVVPTIALAVVVDALFALWLALLRRRAND